MNKGLNRILILVLSILSFGCHPGEHGSSVSKHAPYDSIYVAQDENTKYRIFDIETSRNELSVIQALEKGGIIKIDSLSVSSGEFQFAVIEFAGVKFGMNKGFNFITSRQDAETINSLVREISRFYGKPEIDGDINEAPEWCYYQWNLNQEAPYIRIRPFRIEEGGLIMMWR